LVCRENERLLKKLSAAGQKTDNTRRPSIDHQSNVSNGLSFNQNGMKDMLNQNLKGNQRLAFDNERQTKRMENIENKAIGICSIKIFFNNLDMCVAFSLMPFSS
jgi:hypothetical protein